MTKIPSIESTESQILKVHSEAYLNSIKNLQFDLNGNIRDKNTSSHTLKEKDSYDNYATFESAKLATGSLIEICKNILSKKIEHGYAIIRPPGHHADMSTARGFCIFNSVAIAVKYILNKNPKTKIAILDWDVHHGDGTQSIFYKDSNPLFISIHRHDNGKFYPFKTGFVKEKGEDIIFLRKIVRGGTDESYGIHVARLAGVPKDVTTRANQILRTIERKSVLNGKNLEKENKKQVEGQFDMFNYKLAEIAQELDKVNLNELTPIDALNTLVRIKERMK